MLALREWQFTLNKFLKLLFPFFSVFFIRPELYGRYKVQCDHSGFERCLRERADAKKCKLRTKALGRRGTPHGNFAKTNSGNETY